MRKAINIVLIIILVYTNLIIMCSVDRFMPPVALTFLTSLCSFFAHKSKVWTFTMSFSYAVNTFVCFIFAGNMTGYMFGGLLPNSAMFLLFNVLMLILMVAFRLVYHFDNGATYKIVCDDCGAEVGENDKFCPHCGTKFD